MVIVVVTSSADLANPNNDNKTRGINFRTKHYVGVVVVDYWDQIVGLRKVMGEWVRKLNEFLIMNTI